MKQYSGWQYLLVDAANNNGLDYDKKIFEERIQWATENLDNLEELAEGKQWKQRPLYLKACQAIRKAQAGKPTGHMVGFDAACSGIQLMSVLTGCEKGAKATGLVDPDRRADAYTDCTAIMSKLLGYHMPNERGRVKLALMTSMYGSKAEPKKEFGDGTQELAAFYKAMYELAPGPTMLLDVLLNSWQSWALTHEWKLPDGFHARIKVMQKVEDCRIEIDELEHTTFTYVYYVNEGEERGVKNAANIVHSVDSYVLRSLIRRCNYDRGQANWAYLRIEEELLERAMDVTSRFPDLVDDTVSYYIDQYDRSGIADIVILASLTDNNIRALSTEHLRGLMAILETMIEHKPFPVVTIHDCFAAHPNNINWVRKHYRNILAELADSNLMQDILTQIHGQPGVFEKLSPNLSEKIRQSNYAIC